MTISLTIALITSSVLMSSEEKNNSQDPVLAFLSKPESYPHPVQNLRHVETHISHVFLTGDFVYKLKKKVKYDFVDFSTLSLRKHFCEEELRLNSRYSQEMYLAVLAITRGSAVGDNAKGGEEAGLEFSGLGEAVEYLVQMRQFDDEQLFQSLVSRGELSDEQVEEAGRLIARFHREAPLTPGFGTPQLMQEALNEVFGVFKDFSPGVADTPIDRELFQKLAEEIQAEFEQISPLLEKRTSTAVRAVHGDLHLSNICVFQNKVHLFDGLEFSPALANGDVWNDLGFLVMDLMFHHRTAQAALLCNVYLEESDDFEGLLPLPFFLAYRAAVRAKIHNLTYSPELPEERKRNLIEEAEQYLELARKVLQRSEHPLVFAFGGLSGSGKSTVARTWAKKIGAVHVRADAVRKHILGMSVHERARSAAYTEEMNEKTYEGLLERMKLALQAGKAVVLDAVFRSEIRREHLREVVAGLGSSLYGFWCSVPPEIAKERIRGRTDDVSDATEDVLLKQLNAEIGDVQWERLDTRLLPDEVVKVLQKKLEENFRKEQAGKKFPAGPQ